MLVTDPQWAIAAMIFALPARIVFGFPEKRQDIVIGPAIAAQRRPVVVIPAIAADIDHGVDRRTPAEPPAAWLIANPAIEPLLRHGFIHVVGFGVRDGEQPRSGYAQPVVASPSLQKAYCLAGFCQPAGDSASATSTTDNDNVELAHNLLSRVGRLGRAGEGCNQVFNCNLFSGEAG